MESKEYSLPSGGPQGDILGMIVFLVEVSDCGMDPPLPAPVTPGDVSCVPAPPPPLQTEDEIRLKFQDDTLLAECIKLKEKLRIKETHGPWNFNEQSGKYLPSSNSVLQTRLSDLQTYTLNHSMRINDSKTKIISFNFTKK